jgi:plasmid stabilization system protein ParE
MGSKKKATAKNFEVSISANALQNIDEITGYIAFVNQQPFNAIRVGDKIFKVIESLAANPFAYRECSEMQTKTKI